MQPFIVNCFVVLTLSEKIEIQNLELLKPMYIIKYFSGIQKREQKNEASMTLPSAPPNLKPYYGCSSILLCSGVYNSYVT